MPPSFFGFEIGEKSACCLFYTINMPRRRHAARLHFSGFLLDGRDYQREIFSIPSKIDTIARGNYPVVVSDFGARSFPSSEL